jgi:hypothetical protein
MRPITGRRRRPRPRSRAALFNALERTPDEQVRAERGDPFPEQPGWTDETLAELHDNDRRTYDGRTHEVRQPTFTPAGPQQLPAPGSYPYQPPRNTQPLRRESGPQPAITRPYANRLQPPPVNLLPDVPRHQPLPPRALLPVRDRRAAEAQERLDRARSRLPAYDGYGHADRYAAYMRSVALITRTHTPLEHAGAWPQPTTSAGGPVPVQRGLTITAGQHLPRHAAATIPVKRRPGRAGPLPPADLDLLARVAASLEKRSA